MSASNRAFFLVWLCGISGCTLLKRDHHKASLAFIRGRVYTGIPGQSAASAVAIRGESILAVGTDEEILTWKGTSTRVIDLQGATVVPGLCDAHGHMEGLGRSLEVVDLTGAQSYSEVVSRVKTFAEGIPKGSWITGQGWNQELWDPPVMPDHAPLSQETPDHPVWLARVDGHAGLANQAAMNSAGVTPQTQEPEGGDILTDEQGEPTGVFVDDARVLISRHVPKQGKEAIERHLLAAQEKCLAAGLTEVHDAGIGRDTLEVYRQLASSGKLKIRIYAMLTADVAREFVTSQPPIQEGRLTVRAVKLVLDGALGSRGAWLFEPYSDRPVDEAGHPWLGVNPLTVDEAFPIVRMAARAGYQTCIHAIGDRANHEALSLFEGIHAELQRPRIEHAQVVRLEDIPRFARGRVIASIQPTHATSDKNMAEKRVGQERIKGAYAWRKLLAQGVILAGGSDFPVESHDPKLGLYAAVTREGWYAVECMSREEALRAFTAGAAFAAFEEEKKGELRPGMWADLTLFDTDVMACEPEDILKAKCLCTVVGGEIVHEVSP